MVLTESSNNLISGRQYLSGNGWRNGAIRKRFDVIRMPPAIRKTLEAYSQMLSKKKQRI